MTGPGQQHTKIKLEKPKSVEVSPKSFRGMALDEFSGLTHADGSFWTLDDERSMIIRLSDQGKIIGAFDLAEGDDLEGISFLESHRLFGVVEEHAGRLIFFRISSNALHKLAVLSIANLENFSTVTASNGGSSVTLGQYYDFYLAHDRKKNSGWEGITFTDDGRLFLLKEKSPSLLVEVKLDFDNLERSQISRMVVLNCGSKSDGELCHRGSKSLSLPFGNKVVVDGDGENLDFSGIQWDAATKRIWITTHKGKSVISLDPEKLTFQAWPLKSELGKCLEQAEGVTLVGSSVFVINDREPEDGPAHLMRFKLAY